MPIADESKTPNEGQVVDFRDASARRVRQQPAAPSPVEDLAKFERDGGDDDYRSRMITNLIALAFLAFLVFAGVWIANTMALIRKNQDCVLSGRRGCTPVDVAPSNRW